MKRTSIAVALLFIAASAFADSHGSWTATLDAKKPGRVYVNMNRGHRMNMGMTMNIADLTGLSNAQINATSSTPVRFELRREAGVITYQGSFRNGDGAGQFDFVANPNYYAALRNLGIDTKLRHRGDDDEDELFSLAVHDVSSAFIRTMRGEGVRGDLDDYVAMRIHGVTPELVREMRALGYKDLDADELVATRIHRVTPNYIRQMRAAGWNLSLDELQASRIHGATPEFAEELRRLGYDKLDHDDLIAFRVHRVTPELIREYRTLGYDRIPADDLLAMRIHRVTPDYIRELAAAGYSKVPVRKLVEMRIHNIDIRKMK